MKPPSVSHPTTRIEGLFRKKGKEATSASDAGKRGAYIVRHAGYNPTVRMCGSAWAASDFRRRFGDIFFRHFGAGLQRSNFTGSDCAKLGISLEKRPAHRAPVLIRHCGCALRGSGQTWNAADDLSTRRPGRTYDPGVFLIPQTCPKFQAAAKS